MTGALRGVSVVVCGFIAASAMIFALLWLTIGGIPFWYQPLERNMLTGFRVDDAASAMGDVLHVTGYVGDSATDVESYTVNVDSTTFVVIVYGGIFHNHFLHAKPTDPDIDILVPVPSNVNRVEFGRRRTVIWQRPPTHSR